MSARYTTKELEALADGQGQIAIDNMRKALRWAARTLEAADAAVQSECARATQAAATEREACALICAAKSPAEYATGKVDHNEMAWSDSCAFDIRARSNAGVER